MLKQFKSGKNHFIIFLFTTTTYNLLMNQLISRRSEYMLSVSTPPHCAADCGI